MAVGVAFRGVTRGGTLDQIVGAVTAFGNTTTAKMNYVSGTISGAMQ